MKQYAAMAHMFLPCGGRAYFDTSSGMSYRCKDCLAVVGSIGMPQECKDEAAKWDNWEKLGGKGWDYFSELNYERTN